MPRTTPPDTPAPARHRAMPITRAAVGLMIAGLVLAGCVAATHAPPGDPAVAVTTLPPPADPEPGPDPAPDSAAPEAPPPEPPALARQRDDCARAGGQLRPRAAGFLVCVRPTRDAGRRCTASADCEGLCLARSGTCAPLHPLHGCHEVLTLPGRRETLCTD